MANTTDWLDISSTSGTSGQTLLTLTASTNSGSRVKSATVKAYNNAYGVTAITTVYSRIQTQIPYTANTSVLNAEGETRTIKIDTNGLVASSITLTTSGASGIAYIYDNGIFTVTFPNNPGDNRTITVTITGTYYNGDGGIATLTYIQPKDYTEDYLTFTILNDPSGFFDSGELRFLATTNGASLSRTIQYSINNGAWTNLSVSVNSSNSTDIKTVSVSPGDVVRLRGNNSSYALISTGVIFDTVVAYCNLTVSYLEYNIAGNIMSLVNSSNFKYLNTLSANATFAGLFKSSSSSRLKDASFLLLPATSLTQNCYSEMFYGCTSLTAVPALPATTLAKQCYEYMFQHCTTLTEAPELPATTLAYACYDFMFGNCTSLTIPPTLPATILADRCYMDMFFKCTALATAPILPATALTLYCYEKMFVDCTSLTQAPELPASVLTNGCYADMFSGCTSLNYIKCLATDISAFNCTANWVKGVAPTGLFYKDADMSGWTIDSDSGIPIGWTAVDYGFFSSVAFIYIPESGDTAQISIINNIGLNTVWTATTNSWISLSQNTGGTGTTTINISAPVTTTPRTGYITFNNGSGSIVVAVLQNDNIIKPLTFNIISGGEIGWYCTSSGIRRTIEYSKDNGSTWTSITSNTAGFPIYVSTGDKVLFRGDNAGYGSISTYSSNNNGFGDIDNTAIFEIEGNIMSLIDSTGFATAITLESSCTFYRLFAGCTGLTFAKNLVIPAATLTEHCYEGMFHSCTSLTQAPALPATTLANSCYENMFSDCPSLTTAPELPVTTLASNCYRYMFINDASLTQAPSLPATTLANYCYDSMFGGCTGLTTAPELPATALTSDCYYGMFNGCTSLTTAPELPATALGYQCYEGMFHSCTSLTQAPALPATTLTTECYANMFTGCGSLTTAPELPATTLSFGCYDSMFAGCTSLTGAPVLPAMSLEYNCYRGMFNGCTSLAVAPEVPATTLNVNCYKQMFAGCTSLIVAPELPAVEDNYYLSGCYVEMFSGCTNLSYIKCLATTALDTQYNTKDWVSGVASAGTFVTPSSTQWTTGNDGIPSGWTRVDAT